VVIAVGGALVVAVGGGAWVLALLAGACVATLLLGGVRAVAGEPELDAGTPVSASGPAIERAPSPASAIERELERCRRHGRSCSVARVAGAQGHLRDLGARVRRTDRVWAVGHDLVLLLPETERVGATRALTRLLDGVRLEVPVAVACFPQDALTAHALVDALRTPAKPSSSAGVAPVRTLRLAPREPAAQMDTSPPS
jgi:hypothetical protein